ncbi:MAG TPA: protease complex subunit PrcB family protein [Caulobacteraceae bacterium]
MRMLLAMLGGLSLAACATAPLPPQERDDSAPRYDLAEARSLTEADARAALGEAAWREITAGRTAVIVRRSPSLPRMIRQPDGTWKPEGPAVGAAVRTTQGWIGWPGGVRSSLAAETGRELDRLLAAPGLWAEPVAPEGSCTDWSGQTTVIRDRGRARTATQVCGAAGLTGQLHGIVMAGRIIDWSTVPSDGRPAGVPITRLGERWEQYFRHSSGLDMTVNLAITSEREWVAMWRRITRRHGEPPDPPAVDFEREMLLLAAMGTQATGGYSIRIEDVIETPDGLEVIVIRTSPGRRCGVTAALTSPVDVVRVPVSSRPVRWSVRDAVTDCP